MTTQSDQIVQSFLDAVSSFGARLSAGDAAIAALSATKASLTSAQAALMAAQSADATDKAARDDALAKVAAATAALTKAQSDLATAQAADAADKASVSSLTDQLAAANAKITALSAAAAQAAPATTTAAAPASTGSTAPAASTAAPATTTAAAPASSTPTAGLAAAPGSTLKWANWHGGQGASAVAAPDGTYTATRVVSQVDDYASFYKSDEPAIAGNTARTAVIYVHADDGIVGEWHYSTASDGTGFAITFDLAAGTTSKLKEYGTGKYAGSSIVALGLGWSLVSITGTMASSADKLQPFPALVVPAGHNGKGFTTWGYQAVDGAVLPAAVAVVAPKPVPKGSMKLTAPVSATQVTTNQAAAGAVSSIGLLSEDTVVTAGQTVFAGTCSTNVLNLEIHDPTTASHRAALDGAGNWSVTVDTTGLPTGPNVFTQRAWDSLPGQPFTVDLRGEVTVYLDNPAKPVPAMAAPALASGLKLIWSEDFSSGKIDTTKWQTGLRNNQAGGSQWGSDAYFGVLGQDAFAGDSYAVPMKRFGRLRAIHDLTFKNPTGWTQAWRSGLLSTAMVDPANAKPVISMKRGVVYLRAMFPAGKGPWPSLWGDTVNAPLVNGGDAQETDLIENNADGGSNGFMTTTHLWATDASRNAGVGNYQQAAGVILGKFVDIVFDFGLTDPDNIIVYIDNVKTGTAPIYPPAKANGTYLMIDLGMGGGWPIEVPPGGCYDLHVQNFGMWSAD